ncbi:hypothetical protein PanWU01x14_140400 [Parasponia andersonii]|uniref:Uncharacterized protein n=1 Tax=Parasponia andersonii TaxID=3476 RepID=A0A2P5CMB4_PARAD|nr:hypothetical protein PanWU01x14_140400 [Parasponia andersonii]
MGYSRTYVIVSQFLSGPAFFEKLPIIPCHVIFIIWRRFLVAIEHLNLQNGPLLVSTINHEYSIMAKLEPGA